MCEPPFRFPDAPTGCCYAPCELILVTIVVWFERTRFAYTDVSGLLF
jgi:hypothetical protein